MFFKLKLINENVNINLKNRSWLVRKLTVLFCWMFPLLAMGLISGWREMKKEEKQQDES